MTASRHLTVAAVVAVTLWVATALLFTVSPTEDANIGGGLAGLAALAATGYLAVVAVVVLLRRG